MRAAWALQQIPAVSSTPEMIYDLYRKHRLVPESVSVALSGFHQMSESGTVYHITAGGEQIATVVVSGVVPGERADIDVIPVSKYFRGGYEEDLRDVMTPVWKMVFEEHNVRRLTSSVPVTRRRTVKALEALGFVVEGVLRKAVKIVNKDPEDLVLLGLLPEDLED